jgi:hypothetical protein
MERDRSIARNLCSHFSTIDSQRRYFHAANVPGYHRHTFGSLKDPNVWRLNNKTSACLRKSLRTDLRAHALMLVDQYSAKVLASMHVGVAIVDGVEGVGTGDQLIELQFPGLIHSEVPENIFRRA